ncbi:phage major capsid protein [Ensifer sp. ENS10]|uniref:phage major capsid protein n=2 Tax=unclassified Ensifer TaxID=2633371 RepID=UPI0017871BC4|nr:phage major capsid protein [Ensifer sp. ENS10]MBD9507937.1 phage major capsid protein [Ensifer sp. ENS10]
MDTFARLENEVVNQKALQIGIERRLRKLSPASPIPAAEPPQMAIVRAILARVHRAASGNRERLDQVIERLFPVDVGRDIHRSLESPGEFLRTRAAVDPAMTTVPGWAAELVPGATLYSGALPLLAGRSVFSRIAARGLAIELPPGGSIRLPNAAPTDPPPSPWVGVGQPIPVRSGLLSLTTLRSHKAAVLSTFSEEIAAHSVPTAESIIADILQSDIARSIDATLLDANAGSPIRPAGLLNGVAPLTAGADAAADIKALVAAISDPAPVDFVIIAATQQAVALSLAYPQLTIPVLASDVLPPGTVIGLDAADFVSSVDRDSFTIAASTEAVLHEESAPDPIVDAGTTASPVRSLWQTDVGVKLREMLGWLMRRPGRVAVMESVSW